jgi:large repetitive protein
VFGGGISATDVEITAVNDKPIPVDDPTPTTTFAAVSGVLLTVPAATGVLVNDSDIDSPAPTSPPLTVAPLATVFSPNGGFATLHGRARLNPDGSFIYQSNPGWVGTDEFSYVVKDIDTSRTSLPAVVRFTVTAAP